MIDLLLKPDESEGYRPLSKDILVDDAYLFCVAGTHTTSFCLSLGTYYLLRHPQKLRRLVEELQTVQKNPDGMLEYRDVCNLPYLVSNNCWKFQRTDHAGHIKGEDWLTQTPDSCY